MHFLFSTFTPSAFVLLAAVLFTNCKFSDSDTEAQPLFTTSTGNSNFSGYWYKGEAELNTYDIQQNRYGEMRDGEAVMVFVTEDFSASKQVKLDNPESVGKDKVPILKLNHIRRFITGIYDYSMMQSVFTPVDLKGHDKTLKTTTTSQDWCGHTFTQVNLEGGKYKVSGFSYFETEGDEISKMDAALLEDELWARLRISPKSIPTGTLEVIPSTFFSRLLHTQIEPKQARIRFEDEGNISHLILEYLHVERSLRIGFEPIFPHKILEWEEKTGGQIMSSGKLKETMKSPYWRQHDNVHEPLRDSLRLR